MEENKRSKRGKGAASFLSKQDKGTGNGTDNTGAETTANQENTTTTQTETTEGSTTVTPATENGGGDDGGNETSANVQESHAEGGDTDIEATGDDSQSGAVTQTGNDQGATGVTHPTLPTGEELNRMPGGDFKPYKDPPIVRDYAVSSGPAVTKEIPEPQFIKPPGFGGKTTTGTSTGKGPVISDISNKHTGADGKGTATGTGAGAQGTTTPLNQNSTVNEMSPKEQRVAAENSVDAFWSLYEKLNDFGYWITHVSDQKLMRKQSKGELDLDDELNVGQKDGKRVTVRGFFESFNLTARKAFTVDEGLKKKLREPMIREALRLGLVMTDGQFIAKELGQDLLTKTITVFALRAQINNAMELISEDFQARKKKEKDEIEEERQKLIKEREKLEKLREAISKHNKGNKAVAQEDPDEFDDEEFDYEQGEGDNSENTEVTGTTGADGVNGAKKQPWEQVVSNYVKQHTEGADTKQQPVDTTTVPVEQQ
jgi:hypothetical protein